MWPTCAIPPSDSLAAVHYKNRYIQTDQCYTCHSDYGMFGTMSAKLEGLGHVYHNIDGQLPETHQDREAPTRTCAASPATAEPQNFVAKHEKDIMPSLLSNENSCLDCHGPAHKPETAGGAPEKQAMR